MSTIDPSEVKTTIQHAQARLAAAELELEDALREIRAVARAEKMHVGERIENAFDALRDAKARLAELESLLASALGGDR